MTTTLMTSLYVAVHFCCIYGLRDNCTCNNEKKTFGLGQGVLTHRERLGTANKHTAAWLGCE